MLDSEKEELYDMIKKTIAETLYEIMKPEPVCLYCNRELITDDEKGKGYHEACKRKNQRYKEIVKDVW